MQIAARAAICKGPGGGCLTLRQQHVLRAAASPRPAGISKPSQNSTAAEIRLIAGHDVGHSEKKIPCGRIWHARCTPSTVNGDLGPRPTAILKWGLRSLRSYGRLPLTRTAKTGCSCRVRGPTFFLFFAVMRGFCRQTLDACGLGALLCGVPGGWISAL